MIRDLPVHKRSFDCLCVSWILVHPVAAQALLGSVIDGGEGGCSDPGHLKEALWTRPACR
jgi:hypothetical protein